MVSAFRFWLPPLSEIVPLLVTTPPLNASEPPFRFKVSPLSMSSKPMLAEVLLRLTVEWVELPPSI